MAPSSRFAVSSKPTVAYLELNFPALLKKQTTLPSFVYAGMPYQVFGQRAGAVASTIACSRLAMTRSGSFIASIAASRSRSPSALFLLARSSAFSSRARALTAARSSAVNPFDFMPVAVVLWADFCVLFFAGFLSAITKYLRVSNGFLLRDLSVRSPDGSAQLLDADQVARGIAEGAVANPVRLLGRLLNDLGVAGLQPLEGGVEVGGGQVDAGEGALGHHFGDHAALVLGDAGRGGRRVQDDRRTGLVRRPDRNPVHAAVLDVVPDLETQRVPIEGQSCVRIGAREQRLADGDGHDGQA